MEYILKRNIQKMVIKMLTKHRLIQTLLILLTGLFINTACALDNPDSPDLLGQFKEREKNYLSAITNPDNGTRDTIRAYHKYKLFLDKELNKTYNILKSNLSAQRQGELKISQQHWIKFRDTEFEFINNNWNRSSFGSSFVISRGDYSSTVIKNRLMQLFHYAKNY